MMLSDDEGKELKTWVIKRLEDISDADSDVLADYVLALLKTDTHELQLRANVITNLEDFLKDNTESFVDEVLLAVINKSYLPSYKPPPTTSAFAPSTTSPSITTDAPFSAPRGPFGPRDSFNGGPQQGRKRSFNQAQDGSFDRQNGRGDRPKFMRRGDGGRGGHGRGGMNGGFQPANLPPLSMSPPAPMPDFMRGLPGMSPFDPSDPLALMLSMQAMGLPGLPQLPLSTSPNPQVGGSFKGNGFQGKNKIDSPCRDYETKGFCARGTSCPFSHGNDRILIPSSQDEYDPKTPSFAAGPKPPFSVNGHSNPSTSPLASHGRGREHSRAQRGNFHPPRRNNNRAEFSSAGPNFDRSLATVVVEQIPEEHFSEDSVRAFFSEFGTVEEVTMKAYKRLAIVKFDDYNSAVAAYESPKVVFDNRFVKVYWYKPDQEAAKRENANGTPTKTTDSPSSKPEEPVFDKEKFERDSLAAQKRLEEKKALLKDAEEKRQALEQQKTELAQKQEEEKRKLLEKLKAKGRSTDDIVMAGSDSNGMTNNGVGSKSPNSAAKANAQTEKLRATLAALEAEAKSLGMDPNVPPESTSPYYRGRGRGRGRGGSYRGWEGFASSGRGGYRGRGGGGGSFRGGAYNLDNRTKKVKVEGAVFDADRDEGLRSFLMSLGEYEAIFPINDSDPTGPQVVTFKDRPTAERFFYGQSDLPGVGKVEFSWVNAPTPPYSQAPAARKADDAKMGGVDDADSGMAEEHLSGELGWQIQHGGYHPGETGAEVDYDVAEENSWEVS